MSRRALIGAAAIIGTATVAVAVIGRVGRPAFSGRARLAATAEEGPVSDTHRVLVLLHEASASQEAARLQGTYRVIALLRPRVLVLQLDDEALAEIGRDSNLAGVYVRDVPADVIDRLRPDERLFVEAWIQQQASGNKQRPGEGLSWDAPGFTPPDPPPRKRP